MGCFDDCCVPPKESREPIRHDPTFNGPIHNRSCTDIIWLFLFILFLGVWVWVGIHSVNHGNIEKLLAPIDSEGKRCGLDAGLEDKKYLVFFDISKCLTPGAPIVGCPTKQVCVKKCPDQTVVFANPLSPMDETTFSQVKSNLVCTYDVDVQALSYSQAKQHIDNGICASYVIKSQPVLSRCIVDVAEAIKITEDSIPGLNETQVIAKLAELVKFRQLSSQIVQDLVQSRWYLVGALAGVLCLCFVYIVLLRWVVAPVVWLSIAGLLAVLSFGLYLCYENYKYFKANPVQLVQTTNLMGYLQSLLSKHQTWLGILIVLAIVLIILFFIVIFLRSRITIAIAMIKEASKFLVGCDVADLCIFTYQKDSYIRVPPCLRAVYAVKSTIFFPVVPWALQCVVIAYGVVVLMLLMSIGESAFGVVNLKADEDCVCSQYKEDSEACNPLTFAATCFSKKGGPCQKAICHFSGINNPTSVPYLHLVNLLAFFWTTFFISGVSDMILASTFSTWYWTFKKKNLPFFTLTSGLFRTFRYHLGTVAFGALIVAIVRVIRVILEYIDQKIKKFDNPFTRCIMCFCKCFCWCLENFLKFVNKNAYIMCAVHGKNFCSSARDAFSLLMRNIIRVVVLDKVTDFIFFLSKMLISIGVGFAVYYLMQWNVVYEITKGERLHYNYVPAIILGIAAYLISTIFFNVYAMAVDTLFLCFLEDCERNDGSPEKPYFMSKNLMRILGNKNKKE